MKLSQLLDKKGRKTLTVDANETLSSVFSVLAQNKIGALVVCNAKGEVVGIISERDLVKAIAKDGERTLSWPVESCMTTDVITCSENDTVNDVMEKMTAGRFRHMPVVENNKLSGVISIGDVVKNRIEEVEREAADIRAYIHAS
ncbi:MAG: CBS domain-containing protein [Hyphomicrobiales bacterium]